MAKHRWWASWWGRFAACPPDRFGADCRGYCSVTDHTGCKGKQLAAAGEPFECARGYTGPSCTTGRVRVHNFSSSLHHTGMSPKYVAKFGRKWGVILRCGTFKGWKLMVYKNPWYPADIRLLSLTSGCLNRSKNYCFQRFFQVFFFLFSDLCLLISG